MWDVRACAGAAASIPIYATGPTLIILGVLMMEIVADIPWKDLMEAVPAFLTIVLMPLTFSISNGATQSL